MEIRLVLIDDNAADLLAVSRAITKSYVNPRIEIALDTRKQPPADLRDLLVYDGIIMDERLDHLSGIDLAMDLNKLDWTVPVMIVSGLAPTAEDFNNALAHVDYVASKQETHLFLQVFGAFVRQVRRIKHYRTGAHSED